ncbi:hypothetical protein JCM8547_002321 [Rhodosporidiobolus lusitaniae]
MARCRKTVQTGASYRFTFESNVTLEVLGLSGTQKQSIQGPNTLVGKWYLEATRSGGNLPIKVKRQAVPGLLQSDVHVGMKLYWLDAEGVGHLLAEWLDMPPKGEFLSTTEEELVSSVTMTPRSWEKARRQSNGKYEPAMHRFYRVVLTLEVAPSAELPAKDVRKKQAWDEAENKAMRLSDDFLFSKPPSPPKRPYAADDLEYLQYNVTQSAFSTYDALLSMYRLAHILTLLDLPDLKELCLDALVPSLSVNKATCELFSDTSLAYDEICDVILSFIKENWAAVKRSDDKEKMAEMEAGELPEGVPVVVKMLGLVCDG